MLWSKHRLNRGTRWQIATLAMLSSHNLMVNSFFSTFPMGALLVSNLSRLFEASPLTFCGAQVDEASQIRLDEYPHVFNRFKKTLERVAFFGDEQQRPFFSQHFQRSHLTSLTRQSRRSTRPRSLKSGPCFNFRTSRRRHSSSTPNVSSPHLPQSARS